VVFPLIHGPMGEDGTLQGLLELMGVAYVGCGVLGSAVAMDKDFAKRLLRDAGIKTAKFEVCYSHDQVMPSYKDLTQLLGSPIIFVKPANMGSSVGISKVKCQESLQKALEDAFLYDHKVIIEEAIDGREIEVAALGNELVKISVAGEIIAEDKFYSYEAKYVNDNKAVLKAPVNLPTDIYENICKIAKRTFKTLGLRGMARIDFFLTSQGEIYVNEANTIPGFTSISMYPKLWEHSGLAYSDLIDELIKLAIKAHQHKQGLQKSFRGSLHAMVQSNP
jgi:D-alanine-D-alanine ligase